MLRFVLLNSAAFWRRKWRILPSGGESRAGLRISLLDPADREFALLVGTGESRRRRAPGDDPGDRVVAGQSLEIPWSEVLPAFLRLHFAFPIVRELRKQRDSAAVLHAIGQRTALGDGAKAVLIRAGEQHVIRVEREHRVFGGVAANPEKGAGPAVRAGSAGPLDVEARRVGSQLDQPHATGQRREQ